MFRGILLEGDYYLCLIVRYASKLPGENDSEDGPDVRFLNTLTLTYPAHPAQAPPSFAVDAHARRKAG